MAIMLALSVNMEPTDTRPSRSRRWFLGLGAALGAAVGACTLYLNGLVGEHETLDQTKLPQIKMPNRNGFVPDTRPDTGSKRP